MPAQLIILQQARPTVNIRSITTCYPLEDALCLQVEGGYNVFVCVWGHHIYVCTVCACAKVEASTEVCIQWFLSACLSLDKTRWMRGMKKEKIFKSIFNPPASTRVLSWSTLSLKALWFAVSGVLFTYPYIAKRTLWKVNVLNLLLANASRGRLLQLQKSCSVVPKSIATWHWALFVKNTTIWVTLWAQTLVSSFTEDSSQEGG